MGYGLTISDHAVVMQATQRGSYRNWRVRVYMHQMLTYGVSSAVGCCCVVVCYLARCSCPHVLVRAHNYVLQVHEHSISMAVLASDIAIPEWKMEGHMYKHTIYLGLRKWHVKNALTLNL